MRDGNGCSNDGHVLCGSQHYWCTGDDGHAGVEQDSPTLCLLFVIFVDKSIKMIKDRFQDDVFFKWPHELVFMVIQSIAHQNGGKTQ